MTIASRPGLPLEVQHGFVAIGADGSRSVKRSAEVTEDDRWILSSCTKSMTASVAAMLVEEGVIRWDSTLGSQYKDSNTKSLSLCKKAY